MNLQDVLLKKARQDELAHFYIVEATSGTEDVDGALQGFVHGLIKNYYQQIEGHKQSMTHLMDHPDVFVLGNLKDTEEPVNTFFTVADSEALARFFEFKAVQSKRKFAVITEAHRINVTVANKWLKLLEEPYGDSTIFLLNPRRQKLLDTIHSRAVHLRLPVRVQDRDASEWEGFLADVKTLSLSQFLERFQKGERGLTFWTEELIRWEAQNPHGARDKEALEEWLKSFQEMELFHQPAATKWTLFYSYLHQHILPRLK